MVLKGKVAKVVWSRLHCQTMLLLATYQVPQLRQIQMPEHGPAVRKGLAIMKIWEASPSVRNAVKRITGVMERVGLATEPEDQLSAPEHTSNDFHENYEENWNPYGNTNEKY
jgi:hypothetical protein